jgi:protein arginine N-methyltransferase 5
MNLPAVVLPPLSQLPTAITTAPPTITTVANCGGFNNSWESVASSYARAVAEACVKAPTLSFQLWVPVCLTAESLHLYQIIYKMCGENHRVSAALVLEGVDAAQVTNPADYTAKQLQLVHVAIGCNVRCVIVPTSIFLTNKRGYPTLPKSTQAVVTEIMRRVGRTVRFVVQGPSVHALPPPSCGSTRCLPYLQYLQHLRKRPEVTAVVDSDEAGLELRYLDVLQRPLQPLKDHLEFGTYEVFEKDPVKYAQYEHAITMALQEMVAAADNDGAMATTSSCTVHVVGAGRGPLVSCVLRAYQRVVSTVTVAAGHLDFAVVAVEKNPSAVLFLQSKLHTDPLWQPYASRILVVHKDMRSLGLADVGNRRCDIVVSELLGSFGCNELSPECLDEYFGRADICHLNTVSIPRRYTSYLSPVHSASLYAEARNQALYPNETESGVIGMQAAMETPYVVRPHAASQMCIEQPCWTFEHPPLPSAAPAAAGRSRERNVALEFSASPTHGVGLASGYETRDQQVEVAATLSPRAATASVSSGPAVIPSDGTVSTLLTGSLDSGVSWMLTGLLGTFTAELYRSRNGEVCQVSTAPSSFSTGMFSWFPLYFPLHESLWVPPNSTIKVWMWRCADADRIWYEWSVGVFNSHGQVVGTSPIHNPFGRSYHVSVST